MMTLNHPYTSTMGVLTDGLPLNVVSPLVQTLASAENMSLLSPITLRKNVGKKDHSLQL